MVHPGGLSDPADRADHRNALAVGLVELGDHATATGSSVRICVENMPPGVYPGSRMGELFDLLRKLGHPRLALALDTGHANLSAGTAAETLAAGNLLATTHVHDNNGRQDAHEPPGRGTIDWPAWGRALDAIGYEGPIMMECIRALRNDPTLYRPEVLRGIAGGSERPVGMAPRPGPAGRLPAGPASLQGILNGQADDLGRDLRADAVLDFSLNRGGLAADPRREVAAPPVVELRHLGQASRLAVGDPVADAGRHVMG